MPQIIELLGRLGLDNLVEEFAKEKGPLNFYPAFGHNPNRQIMNIISPCEAVGVQTVDATWWFDCTAVDDSLTVGNRTTFNARNLESPYWKSAFSTGRIVSKTCL